MGLSRSALPPAAEALAATGQNIVDANGSPGGELCSSLVRAAHEAGFPPCFETSISTSPWEVLPALRDMDSLTLVNRESDSQGLRSNSTTYYMCNLGQISVSVFSTRKEILNKLLRALLALTPSSSDAL